MLKIKKEEFYNRQTLLKELGLVGQQKLANARIAVVGVGGLGCASSLYLSLAGVGYIRLIDYDTVKIHNLHRQILYTSGELGQNKAEVAAERLRKQNPFIKIEAVTDKVTEVNVEGLLSDVDCVVDGLDNLLTRYLVNHACVKMQVPYIFGAATGLEGNLSVFSPPETGCLECIMPKELVNIQKKSEFGIIGATSGVIGTLQALETIKLLAGIGKLLKNELMVYDFRDMNLTVVKIAKNSKCNVCSV